MSKHETNRRSPNRITDLNRLWTQDEGSYWMNLEISDETQTFNLKKFELESYRLVRNPR